MLPCDVKKRKEALAAEKERKKQTQLDPHLKERSKKERVISYSHELFRKAAIEWLIATDQVRLSLVLAAFGTPYTHNLDLQPISALEHPLYARMIETAAAARDGVEIPSRKVARQEIVGMFQEHMRKLKAKLNVRFCNSAMSTSL